MAKFVKNLPQTVNDYRALHPGMPFPMSTLYASPRKEYQEVLIFPNGVITVGETERRDLFRALRKRGSNQVFKNLGEELAETLAHLRDAGFLEPGVDANYESGVYPVQVLFTLRGGERDFTVTVPAASEEPLEGESA